MKWDFGSKIKYSYLEDNTIKRRIIAFLLTINVGFSIGASLAEDIFQDLLTNHKETLLKIIDYLTTTTTLNNYNDITAVLNYAFIDINEVHNTIDSNDNIPTYIKNIAHFQIQTIYNNYPNFDFRLYCENIKSLTINIISLEELRSNFGLGVDAIYDFNSNTIYITPNTDKIEICHELCHLLKTYYRDENSNIITSYYYEGRSLNEAMNSNINSLIKKDNAYQKERAILFYFQTCVDFTIDDYSSYSIRYLVDLLKEKYPSININYLVQSLDINQDTMAQLNEQSYLDTDEKFFNGLFDICLANINPNNVYESFLNFLPLFKYTFNEDIKYTYLDKYNDFLLNEGYNIISLDNLNNDLKDYKNYIGILYNDNEIYPTKRFFNYEYTIIKDNKEQIIPGNNYKYLSYTIDDLISIYLKNNNIDYALIKEYLLKNNEDYKDYNISLNNNLLYSNTLSNIEIKIVLNTDDTIGYILKNNIENNSYINHYNIKDIKNASNFITLKKYIGNHPNIDINLDNYLTKQYLQYLVSYNPYVFGNIYIQNNDIIFTPLYELTIINDNNETISFDYLFNYNVTFNGSNCEFFQKDISFSLTTNYIGKINLQDIFNYYNLLDDNSHLVYTENEIKTLIINYINEKSIEKIIT